MASESVLEITDANFQTEVLNSDKPVLVDFWAEWCTPCLALAPTIDALAKEFQGKVKVGKINTEHNNAIPVQYGIQAIPTVILFNKGQIVQKFVGLRNKKDFVAELQKVAV